MDYAKLIAHFNDGTLDKSKYKLEMDNDDGFVGMNNDYADTLTNSDIDKEIDKLEKEYGRSGGYSDIVKVLNAAGVPCDWV